MNTLLYALIREAIEFQAAAFDTDEDISGADLTEWFAEWRLRARAALCQTRRAKELPCKHR